jgi:FtsH-binding integral membrane protein
MAFAASARERFIPGAVATLGVSDRVAFLRRTYALLGVALLAFAALTGGILYYATDFSMSFAQWAILGGGMNWLIVLGLFMVTGIVAQKLAMSDRSRGLQYLGLGIAVVAESILLQPLLVIALSRFGGGVALTMIGQATVITLGIFIGLTLTVFITKKDFSFMRGVLSMLTWGALAVILASMLFGFSLGIIFVGFMIMLMGGYILYQTSIVMRDFPPQAHVAAALMLFSTIATLFWYVLQLLMSRRD